MGYRDEAVQAATNPHLMRLGPEEDRLGISDKDDDFLDLPDAINPFNDLFRSAAIVAEGGVFRDGIDTDFQNVTAAFTLTDHHIIFVDMSGGAYTLSIPDAALYPGREYIIKKTETSAFDVTISPAAGLIEGLATLAFGTGVRDSRTIKSDGTGWWII